MEMIDGEEDRAGTAEGAVCPPTVTGP